MKRNSLIVAVVGASLALPFVAHGAAISAGTNKYSKEYSERAVALGAPTKLPFTRTVAASSYNNFELSSAVNTGDSIVLTLGGTAGANFSTADSITLYCDSTDDADLTDEAGKAMSAATAPTATTLTVTATANCAATKKIYLSGAQLTLASMQTVGTITLAATVSRAGTAIDTATALKVADVVQELAVAVTRPYNGQIDNSNGSKSFTNSAGEAGETTRLDRLTLSFTDVDVHGTTDVTPATDDAAVVTLGGDFAYLNDDGVASCLSTDIGADTGRLVVTTANDIAIDTGCSSITITQSAANSFTATSATYDIVANAADLGASNWFKNQTFTGSVTLKWTAAGNAVAQTRSAALTVGAHTGSGATVFIPYMPVGPNISQILYVTNTANVAGTLTMSAYDDSGVACGTAAFGGNIAVGARRVTNLASALAAGIAACGGAAASKKWYLTITASLPDSALEVYSAYNVGGSDRANVINSSNGRATATGMGNANSNGAN